jgi:hypothetical protein
MSEMHDLWMYDVCNTKFNTIQSIVWIVNKDRYVDKSR